MAKALLSYEKSMTSHHQRTFLHADLSDMVSRKAIIGSAASKDRVSRLTNCSEQGFPSMLRVAPIARGETIRI
jgi:hypothetical protein